MALYVAVCLIAALTALRVSPLSAHPGLVGHNGRFGSRACFRVPHCRSTRARRRPPQGRSHRFRRSVAGAAAVAVLVSVPVLLVAPAYELAWAGYTCAAIIGVVGYLVARGAAHGRIRAVLFGLAVLVAAFAVAAQTVGGSLVARICLRRHLHADDLRDRDGDVVGPAAGNRLPSRKPPPRPGFLPTQQRFGRRR